MSKYKLKKEYPNSPELGYVIEEKLHYGTWGYFLNCFPLYPDKYPEFWEKVVEQDYEILSFKQTSLQTGLWTKFGDVWGRNMNGACATSPYKYEEILNNPLYVIYSVKRLSDGEIFTVGDFVDINNAIGSSNKNLTITGFNIDNVLSVLTNDKINNNYAGCKGFNISIAEHSKRKPLFKTADDVDIYEGDSFWFVKHNTSPSIDRLWCIKKVNNYSESNTYFKYEPQYEKYFSTRELAEEYLIMNKPCLSIKDCMGLTSMFTMEEDLKQIVKKRL